MKRPNDSKKPRKKRGPNIPKPITPERKLVSRIEAARITGFSVDTLKGKKKRRGGSLDVIKLAGLNSNTYYRIEQINQLIEASVWNDPPCCLRTPRAPTRECRSPRWLTSTSRTRPLKVKLMRTNHQ